MERKRTTEKNEEGSRVCTAEITQDEYNEKVVK